MLKPLLINAKQPHKYYLRRGTCIASSPCIIVSVELTKVYFSFKNCNYLQNIDPSKKIECCFSDQAITFIATYYTKLTESYVIAA